MAAAGGACAGTKVLRRLFPRGPDEAGPRGRGGEAGRRTRPGRASKMEAVTEGNWESLPVALSPGVLQALRELGFARMTPVQVSGRSPPAPGPRLSPGGGAGQWRGGRAWGRRVRAVSAAPVPARAGRGTSCCAVGVRGLGHSPEAAGQSSRWSL